MGIALSLGIFEYLLRQLRVGRRDRAFRVVLEDALSVGARLRSPHRQGHGGAEHAQRLPQPSRSEASICLARFVLPSTSVSSTPSISKCGLICRFTRPIVLTSWVMPFAGKILRLHGHDDGIGGGQRVDGEHAEDGMQSMRA